MSRFDTAEHQVRNVAVEARRALEWVIEWPTLQGDPRLTRLREVVENLQRAVDRYDDREMTRRMLPR